MKQTFEDMARQAHGEGSPDSKLGTGAGSVAGSVASRPSSASPDEAASSVAPEEVAKPSRQKDIVRVRAGLFEKNKKLLAALESEHNASITAAKKCISDHDGEKDAFEHFFDILAMRLGLLQALMSSQAAFQAYTSDEGKLNYQPVPQEQLKGTLVFEELNKLNINILACEDKDLMEKSNTELKNFMAIHSQTRNAVKSSTRDIENAVKGKAKRIQAAAKKAAANEQKEKLKQEKEKAAAAKAAAGKSEPAQSPNILQHDVSKFPTHIESFDSVQDFESKAKDFDGSKPFCIKKFVQFEEFLAQSVPFKCQLTNFGHQFQGTGVFKKTGRAQCPVNGEDVQKPVGEIFDRVLAKCLLPLPTGGEHDAEVKMLKPVLHSALFGFASDMEYAGLEDKSLGQLRYVHSGVRKVCLVPLTDFLDHMISDELPASIGDVIHEWKGIRLEHLLDDKVAEKVFAGVQSAGSLLYVPPGWLVAEQVENGNPLVGLRRSVLVKVKPDQMSFLVKLVPDAQPVKGIVQAYLKLLEAQK